LKKTDLPLKIGITGGIGSGKTLGCKIFRILGVPVFEADKAAREVMDGDVSLRETLIKKFGAGIYHKEGGLNRKLLASIIFRDNEALQSVNRVVHPLVYEKFEAWHPLQKSDYVLQEAAVLFESGYYKYMDGIILVTAPEELRIRRVMERDSLTEEQVRARIRNQWEEGKMAKLARFIIQNDEKEFLMEQILNIDKKIREDGKIC